MEYIIEHYGLGLLELIGSAAIVGIYALFLYDGGMIYNAVCAFMQSICG